VGVSEMGDVAREYRVAIDDFETSRILEWYEG